MKKQLMIVGIIILLIVVGLIGCIKENILPDIKFEKEGRWLKVISIDRVVNWSSINITISSGSYSDIQFSPAPHLSATYSYGNSVSCPDNWGNVTQGNAIHFLLFSDDINVTLNWIPTNKIIGEWNI